MGNLSLLFLRESTPLNDIELKYAKLADELLCRGFFRDQRFTFIGIYYSNATGICVIGYPKYIMPQEEACPENIIQHVKLICDVAAQHYNAKIQSLGISAYSFDTYAVDSEHQWVAPYLLATFILKDYMEYGLYTEKSKHFKCHGSGAISWNKTIQSIVPVMAPDPIYPTFVHQRTKRNTHLIITPLHKWIIRSCANLLKEFGDFQSLVLPEISEPFENDELSQYVPYLLSRIPYVYSEREIRLFKALSAWCGQSSFCRKCIGVTSFEILWEFAAKSVFGNVSDTKSGPPSYWVNGTEYTGRGEFIPDILRVFLDPSGSKIGYLGILDAKYYYPSWDKMRKVVDFAPANSDISKQIAYYHYLKNLYGEKNVQFTNAFLVPGFLEAGTLYRHLGHITGNKEQKQELSSILGVATPSNMDVDRVLLYQVDPELLFHNCIKHEVLEDKQFIEDFILPFQKKV